MSEDLKKYKAYVHSEMRFADLLPLFRSASYSNYDELDYIILCPECEEWTWVKFNLSSGFLDFSIDQIQHAWNRLDKLSKEAAEGRINLWDLVDTLREEYGVDLIT